MKRAEHAEQAALVAWARAAADTGHAEAPDGRRVTFTRLQRLALSHLHHSRNGGRSKGENGRAKALGTVAGFPDLFLPYPRNAEGEGAFYPCGLMIEMKAPKGRGNPAGRTSKAQSAVHEALGVLGYEVAVCYGYDEARAAVLEYLS